MLPAGGDGMETLTRELTMPRVSRARTIVADIRVRVRSGELQPSARLPTIAQMADQYGCSIGPVKEAIRVLEATGYVETEQGRGIFIAKVLPPDQPIE